MTATEDILLSFEELIAVCGGEHKWVMHLIEESIIEVNGDPQQARFDGLQLARVRRAQRLCRDFDASVPAVGLILELLDEIEEMRKSNPVLHDAS